MKRNPRSANVGQSRRKTRAQRPTKSVKFSGRITPELAATKPQGMSWARYIERLIDRCKRGGLFREELLRAVAVATITLDRMCREVPERFPDDSSRPVSEEIDRIAALMRLIEEIAALRSILEEVLHAL